MLTLFCQCRMEIMYVVLSVRLAGMAPGNGRTEPLNQAKRFNAKCCNSPGIVNKINSINNQADLFDKYARKFITCHFQN